VIAVLHRPKKPVHVLAGNGKPVRLRGIQSLLWKIIAGLAGAGFIAGLYFGGTQVYWSLPAGYHIWLKPWWDGLFHQSWWPVYRHTAFRDIPEPAFATMGVLTLVVKEKYWDKPVGTLRLVTAPLVLILATFALGVGGTWLLNFYFTGRVHDVLMWHSIGDLILGFLIGKILHSYWAPVGATIQGHILDDSAGKAAFLHKVPMWVRWPLSEPGIRERFSVLYAKALATGGLQFADRLSRSKRWTIAFMILVFLAVTVLGWIGHYWYGTGHSFFWLRTR
jgi:hypothetical protein